MQAPPTVLTSQCQMGFGLVTHTPQSNQFPSPTWHSSPSATSPVTTIPLIAPVRCLAALSHCRLDDCPLLALVLLCLVVKLLTAPLDCFTRWAVLHPTFTSLSYKTRSLSDSQVHLPLYHPEAQSQKYHTTLSLQSLSLFTVDVWSFSATLPWGYHWNYLSQDPNDYLDKNLRSAPHPYQSCSVRVIMLLLKYCSLASTILSFIPSSLSPWRFLPIHSSPVPPQYLPSTYCSDVYFFIRQYYL